jgi:hypothetical protein
MRAAGQWNGHNTIWEHGQSPIKYDKHVPGCGATRKVQAASRHMHAGWAGKEQRRIQQIAAIRSDTSMVKSGSSLNRDWAENSNSKLGHYSSRDIGVLIFLLVKICRPLYLMKILQISVPEPFQREKCGLLHQYDQRAPCKVHKTSDFSSRLL